MGLWDWFVGKRDDSFAPKSALALAALSMVTANGTVKSEEVGVLTSVKAIDHASLTIALAKFKRVWMTSQRCVDLVNMVLNHGQKRSAIVVLTDIATSDGEMTYEERSLLNHYLEAFEIEASFAKHIEMIVSIKNQLVFNSIEQGAGEVHDVLSPKRALGLACLSMIAADEVIEEEELGVLRSIHILKADDVLDALDQLDRLDQDPSQCVDVVTQALNVDQQASALAIMFDIAMANGDMAVAEQHLLDQYIQRFGVSEELVRHLKDVIGLKNSDVFNTERAMEG